MSIEGVVHILRNAFPEFLTIFTCNDPSPLGRYVIYEWPLKRHDGRLEALKAATRPLGSHTTPNASRITYVALDITRPPTNLSSTANVRRIPTLRIRTRALGR